MPIYMQENSRSTLIFVNHSMSEKIYQIETQSVFNNCWSADCIFANTIVTPVSIGEFTLFRDINNYYY